MMREIRFRAWDRDKKRMLPSWGIFKTYFGDMDIDSYIVMQYTGLKDKNGKEICEGDICESHQYEYWQRGIVTWINNSVSFMLIQGNSFIGINDNDGLCNEDLEVIGNVYENPELLEGK